MKKLKYIISDKKFRKLFFWQIVFEWEESIGKLVNLKIIKPKNKWYRIIWCFTPFNELFIRKPFLKFHMAPYLYKGLKKFVHKPNQNHVPYIIDYFVSESKFDKFIKNYKNCNYVLISSKEVFDYLKKKKPPFKLIHIPISLPQKWIKPFKKDFNERTYDIGIIGRKSRIFDNFLKEYEKRNGNLNILTNERIGYKYIFKDSNNQILGEFETREQYFNLIRKCKIFLYATPGIEDMKSEITNGFSQVTPRFLEALSCGCNVMLLYKKNSDTDFFQLNKFGKSIETYEDFEKEIKFKLNNAPDYYFYENYLNKFSTENVWKDFSPNV